jgi:phosphatidylglycerol:prolipoprotein diacylglycerol transferase
VNGYPWVFAAGVLGSLIWLTGSGKAREAGLRLDAGLAVLGGGLLGARLAYVLTHWGYYSGNGIEAVYFWQGGLSWFGGAVGGSTALAVFARMRRERFWFLADALAVPAALMSLTAWLGCWLDGCAYGRRADPGWLTPESPDLFGLVAPRWPTQALGVGLSLATAALLRWVSGRRLAPGALGALSLSMIAASALGLGFLRGDPVPAAFSLRLEGVGSGAILAVAAAALGLRLRQREGARP